MYNHTGLQGRLTADPELRHTPSGVAITSFRLASDTGRKTKDGQKITNFIDCVASVSYTHLTLPTILRV